MGRTTRVDPGKLESHLSEVVRSTVEMTLNQLLDAEADDIAAAGRYERSDQRRDTRAGSYERKLQTKIGEVKLKLKVPRLSSASPLGQLRSRGHLGLFNSLLPWQPLLQVHQSSALGTSAEARRVISTATT